MSLHVELQNFANWLRINPGYAGLAAFIISFTESIALIGTLVPSTVVMTALGMMIGSELLSPSLIIGLSIAGALVGDIMSFFLGYYYKSHLNQLWLVRRYPHFFDHAQAFFEKHGGKSVFLGRFIGPIRAIIPMLAGILRMQPLKFLIYDGFAAMIWAPAYMLPGFLIGVAAMALPASIATKLIGLIFILLIVVWILLLLANKFLSYILNQIDKELNKLWKIIAKTKRLRFICTLLYDPRHPDSHGQLVLGFIALLSACLFLLILTGLFFSHHLIQINHEIYYFLRGFRFHVADKFMVFVSTFGEDTVILPLVVTLSLWLGFTKHWRAAWHWLIICMLFTGIAYALKTFYFSPRPIGIFYIKPTSSFPSGHATLATGFYGFLAWLICLDKPHWKKIVYTLTGSIIFLIAFSRIYLGEHWLTDVLAGFFLSVTIASSGAISYQRRLTQPPKAIGLIIVTLLTLTLTGGYFLKKHYQEILKDTSPVWIQKTIPMNDWWTTVAHPAPYYRLTRFGHPAELLNIQWAGNLPDIRAELSKHGWMTFTDNNHREILQKFNAHHTFANLNRLLLPRLLDDHKPVLSMIHFPKNKNRHPELITLWPADTVLTPQNIPLWVGTIDYYPPIKEHKFHGIYLVVPQRTAINALKKSLMDSEWELNPVQKDSIPLNLLPSPETPHYVIFIRPKP